MKPMHGKALVVLCCAMCWSSAPAFDSYHELLIKKNMATRQQGKVTAVSAHNINWLYLGNTAKGDTGCSARSVETDQFVIKSGAQGLPLACKAKCGILLDTSHMEISDNGLCRCFSTCDFFRMAGDYESNTNIWAITSINLATGDPSVRTMLSESRKLAGYKGDWEYPALIAYLKSNGIASASDLLRLDDESFADVANAPGMSRRLFNAFEKLLSRKASFSGDNPMVGSKTFNAPSSRRHADMTADEIREAVRAAREEARLEVQFTLATVVSAALAQADSEAHMMDTRAAAAMADADRAMQQLRQDAREASKSAERQTKEAADLVQRDLEKVSRLSELAVSASLSGVVDENPMQARRRREKGETGMKFSKQAVNKAWKVLDDEIATWLADARREAGFKGKWGYPKLVQYLASNAVLTITDVLRLDDRSFAMIAKGPGVTTELWTAIQKVLNRQGIVTEPQPQTKLRGGK